ncbi:hypothetical protein P154DRAFT_587125 [Amniculicola lignicola CBS 123094]|uniref:Uncharacterized protein n=1 Tax=Amniculicola lignicola CBS 123094 TaxID=1392246 RepID=A0A6A5WWC6_9PLEO|nr:hypothetical protein P154DRAFT_587125 [Amniculicola lignicola CBS 123094]
MQERAYPHRSVFESRLGAVGIIMPDEGPPVVVRRGIEKFKASRSLIEAVPTGWNDVIDVRLVTGTADGAEEKTGGSENRSEQRKGPPRQQHLPASLFQLTTAVPSRLDSRRCRAPAMQAARWPSTTPGAAAESRRSSRRAEVWEGGATNQCAAEDSECAARRAHRAGFAVRCRSRARQSASPPVRQSSSNAGYVFDPELLTRLPNHTAGTQDDAAAICQSIGSRRQERTPPVSCGEWSAPEQWSATAAGQPWHSALGGGRGSAPVLGPSYRPRGQPSLAFRHAELGNWQAMGV